MSVSKTHSWSLALSKVFSISRAALFTANKDVMSIRVKQRCYAYLMYDGRELSSYTVVIWLLFVLLMRGINGSHYVFALLPQPVSPSFVSKSSFVKQELNINGWFSFYNSALNGLRFICNLTRRCRSNLVIFVCFQKSLVFWRAHLEGDRYSVCSLCWKTAQRGGLTLSCDVRLLRVFNRILHLKTFRYSVWHTCTCVEW